MTARLLDFCATRSVLLLATGASQRGNCCCLPFPFDSFVPQLTLDMQHALLGHVGEGLGQMLLAEGQLADGPDLGVLCHGQPNGSR